MPSFTITAIRRPVVEVEGSMLVDMGKRGILEIGDDALCFEDWRIPYRKIRSGVLHQQYLLMWPTYALHLSDGCYNYLFNLPRSAVRVLPFPVSIKSFGNVQRMLGWLLLAWIVLSFTMKLAHRFFG